MQDDHSWSTARLDQLERIAIGGRTWQPIRRPLGVTAFGINAYLAADAGDELLETHDELGTGAGGHEELYLVVSGRATFTVDEAEVDAPAGTILFVPDPATRRGGVAREPGTQVVVVGGRPGAALPVAAYEHWFAAEPAYQAGDYERAIEIVSAGFDDHPDHASIHYQLACYLALAGRRDEAIEHLKQAYTGDPRTREWAADDVDLESIRDAVA
jgi:tetratricopeptide (TPR) repeat protein